MNVSRLAILRYLARNGSSTFDELRRGLRVSGGLRFALLDMQRDERIKREGDQWGLTRHGVAVLRMADELLRVV